MTDRELLELAAKAAVINGEYSEEYQAFNVSTATLRTFLLWNPLENDGDALRLAVKLKLKVTQFPVAVDVYGHWSYGATTICERTGNDPYAATRRAITRAAAKIGRSMG